MLGSTSGALSRSWPKSQSLQWWMQTQPRNPQDSKGCYWWNLTKGVRPRNPQDSKGSYHKSLAMWFWPSNPKESKRLSQWSFGNMTESSSEILGSNKRCIIQKLQWFMWIRSRNPQGSKGSVMFGDVNESGSYAWEHQRCIIQKLTKEVSPCSSECASSPEILKNPRDLLISEVHQCESGPEILKRDYRWCLAMWIYM